MRKSCLPSGLASPYMSSYCFHLGLVASGTHGQHPQNSIDVVRIMAIEKTSSFIIVVFNLTLYF